MSKITPEHLARQAVVYIRQSTPDQVTNNLESKRRQYGLYHWPHVPRQDEVQQKIDAESSIYAGFLLCTPTSIMPVEETEGHKPRSSRRLGLR
jgi:hypothetical protein